MSEYVIPSTPEDRKRLAGMFREISNSLTRIEAERDLIKEIKANIKDEFELPTKVINLLAKLYHEQSKDEYFDEQSEIETLYESVFELTSEGEYHE